MRLESKYFKLTSVFMATKADPESVKCPHSCWNCEEEYQ
jgi:hypothetical protein